jgi:rubrerythrin
MERVSQSGKNSESRYDTELDLQIVREDLSAELLAINQYQEHIESLTNEEAIATLKYIRDNKKAHVSILLKVIKKLDSIQSRNLSKEIKSRT